MPPLTSDRVARCSQLATDGAIGQAALQRALSAGKLPGNASRGGDQSSLLLQLDRLATQSLVAGISRKDLLAETIQEIADPAAINQRKKGTCVATVAIILLAKSDPAEYVRLVAGLSTPKGIVTTARGDRIERESDWQAADGGRSTSQQLLQPALMELGNGTEDYRNSADKSFDSEDLGSEGKGGLDSFESQRLLTSVLDRKYRTETYDETKPDEVFSYLEAALAKREKVPCSLSWIKGSHKVLAERIAGDRVYFINPWGKEESLSKAKFKARLTSLNRAA